ncbi:SIS domain-containing protein [Paraclostridium bifermentans]|uniref:SIS domain-containing protein n=1 Tax=Paraclostridium bifermentans TaxID=1490 RepID=A0ABY8R3A8_PARBF|nr:SIS domain-containing protein [Paraclostridium bifermentans]
MVLRFIKVPINNKCKRIYFIGIGYSGIIAQDSNYKFMRIGLNCLSFDSSHTMIMMASIMQKEIW